MKNLLSLFDYSGTWSQPFEDRGWNVHRWDIKINEFLDVNSIDSVETALDLFEDIDGIIAAVPCTEFTASCAQYWKIKDEDGRTAKAIELVNQVKRLADLFTPTDPEFDGSFFWAMENPVGRIPSLFPELGKAFYFDPCDFAGYLNPSKKDLSRLNAIRKKNGIDVTKEEFDFVVKFNAYTKKTGLWGDFNRNMEKRPIEVVKCSPTGSMVMRYNGGKKGKEERSITPEGFAEAFYQANKDYRGAWADQ